MSTGVVRWASGVCGREVESVGGGGVGQRSLVVEVPSQEVVCAC